jgi:hypothetical protein
MIKLVCKSALLSVSILVFNILYILCDSTDDEFYKKPEYIKMFVVVFQSTVFKIQEVALGAGGGWLNDFAHRVSMVDHGHYYNNTVFMSVEFGSIFLFWFVIFFITFKIVYLRRQIRARNT